MGNIKSNNGVFAHRNFRDVAINIVNFAQYKPGFYDIKFYWVYPRDLEQGLDTRYIFSKPEKLRLSTEKWSEFKRLY